MMCVYCALLIALWPVSPSSVWPPPAVYAFAGCPYGTGRHNVAAGCSKMPSQERSRRPPNQQDALSELAAGAHGE